MSENIPITKDSIDKTLAVADEINVKIKLEQERLPFNMNIIDELHANENAHTRILLKLLQYPHKGSYPILSSFLGMANDILFENSTEQTIDTDIKQPVIKYGQEYIDGLIEGNGQGIIIENKIHFAVDQNAQIERYINNVRSHNGIKNNNIYVIYLTLNGSKEIQDYSLTDEAKKELGYTKKHPGRFIRMNYRDHIIKWLKDEVLPNCCIKEDLLISAIKQYIDHLEGLTRTRKNNTNMNEEIKNYLFSKLNISDSNKETLWSGLSEECGKIQEVLNSLDGIRKEMSDEAYKQLTDISVDVLDSITISGEWQSYRGGGFVQMHNKAKWPDPLHFEWYPIGADDFMIHGHEFKLGFHMEGKYKSMRETVKTYLYDTLKDIQGLQIFQEGKLQHSAALFEKSYNIGEISFVDLSDEKKREFFKRVYSEYNDFIAKMSQYIKDNNLKIG